MKTTICALVAGLALSTAACGDCGNTKYNDYNNSSMCPQDSYDSGCKEPAKEYDGNQECYQNTPKSKDNGDDLLWLLPILISNSM